MKRFLALLLALSMLFCLAACGEKNPANNENNDNKPNTNENEITELLAGFSIADVNALVGIFAGGSAPVDLSGIKDVYFEVGATQSSAVLGMGANLNNKNYDIDMFMGEAIILSAPALLDQNYGITMAGMESFMEGLMQGVTGSMAPSTGSVAGMMTSVNPELVASLLTKYSDMLIDELKKAEGITASSNGGNTEISGQLTAAGAANMVVNLLEAVLADEDFYALVGPLTGKTPADAKADILEGKPATADLIAQLTDAFNAYQLTAKINSLVLDSKNMPQAADLYISLNPGSLAEVAVKFDLDKGTFTGYLKLDGTELFGMEIGDNKCDARFTVDGAAYKFHMDYTDSSFNAYLEENGQKLGELVITISDTELNIKLVIVRTEYVVNVKITDSEVTGTLAIDGQEMGKLIFGKKVEGSKSIFTLKSLTVNATTIDFTSAGICFYVDTNPKLPTAPSNYTDISGMTQDELAAIGNKFLEDNADLIEWFGATFGG